MGWKLPEEKQKEVVEAYSNGMLIGEVKKEFGVSRHTIRKYLRLYNVPLRSRSESKKIYFSKNEANYRYHSFNEEYFKVWSPNMVYILGFIYADGNIIYDESPLKNKYYLRIRLKDDEYNIALLKKIKEELEFSGDLVYEKVSYRYKGEKAETNSVGITINSKKLVESLMDLGLTPNKSLTKEFPKIPKEYEIDFIRGYFDGNGSIYAGLKNKLEGFTASNIKMTGVKFSSGSYKFLNSLQEVLQRYGLKPKNVNSSKRKNAYSVGYYTKETPKMYELFYKNSSLYLDNKYQKFNELVNLLKQKEND